MDYTIRSVLWSDLSALAILEHLCFSLPWSENSLREEFHNDLAVMLCAEWNHTIVGWAGFEFVCEEGSVTNVAVTPSCQGQGIGHALTTALIDRARALSLHTLTLEVRNSNACAIALYEKLGFLRLGLRPHFYEHPEEDALMMRLML